MRSTSNEGLLLLLDPGAVLDALGVRAVERSRGELWAPCPLPQHREREPSFHVSTRYPKRGRWYCFGCARGGTLVGLTAILRGMSGEDAAAWLAERFSLEALPSVELPVPEPKTGRVLAFPSGIVPAAESPIATRYLEWRGVTSEQIERHGLAYWPARRRIVIPSYSLEGELLTYDARAVYRICPRDDSMHPAWLASTCGKCGAELEEAKPKTFGASAREGARVDEAIVGVDVLLPGEIVVVVEGPFDALALERAGFPACALRGSRITESQIETLRALRRSVVVLPDGDAAGVKLARACRETAPDFAVGELPPRCQPDSPGLDLAAIVAAALSPASAAICYSAPLRK